MSVVGSDLDAVLVLEDSFEIRETEAKAGAKQTVQSHEST